MGGADKALVFFAGRSLITAVIDRFAPQVSDIAISARGDAGRFAALGLPMWPAYRWMGRSCRLNWFISSDAAPSRDWPPRREGSIRPLASGPALWPPICADFWLPAQSQGCVILPRFAARSGSISPMSAALTI